MKWKRSKKAQMDSKKHSHSSSSEGKNEEKKLLNFTAQAKQPDMNVDETNRLHFPAHANISDARVQKDTASNQQVLKVGNIEEKQSFSMSLTNLKDFKKEYTDENLAKIRNSSLSLDTNSNSEMFRPYVV
jgi:hypothetical protein